MGRRGPRPTPTAILRLRGSGLAGRARGEPQAPPGIPPAPGWLTEESKLVWDQIVPVLDFMQVLTRADANALARYCTVWVRWRRAEDFIQRYGSTYPIKDESGNVKCFLAFPEVAIAHRLAMVLTRLEAEFGLTPSARSRVNVEFSARLRAPVDPLEAEKRAFFERGGISGWSKPAAPKRRKAKPRPAVLPQPPEAPPAADLGEVAG
jgi:P27 family predicted phage terminase small subunit